MPVIGLRIFYDTLAESQFDAVIAEGLRLQAGDASSPYSLFTNNCHTTVRTIFDASGVYPRFPWYELGLFGGWMPWNL
jgi:hypothetical protein